MNWQLIFVIAIILAAAIFAIRGLLRKLNDFRRPDPGCGESCGCGHTAAGQAD